MLISLAGVAADDPRASRPGLTPFCTHRMGAVFNHLEIMRLRQFHQSIHIHDMSAHMRQHQNIGLIGLGGQILKINDQPFCHAHKNRHSTNRCNGAGNRRERKGIGQNPIARLHTERAQSRGERIAARGHSETIARAHLRGKLLLQKRSLRHFTGSLIVAMQPPVLHDRNCRRNGFVQNRFLLGEIARENLCHGAGFGLAAYKVNPLLLHMSQTDQNSYSCAAGLRQLEAEI